jgi:hypothetical protein
MAPACRRPDKLAAVIVAGSAVLNSCAKPHDHRRRKIPIDRPLTHQIGWQHTHRTSGSAPAANGTV